MNKKEGRRKKEAGMMMTTDDDEYVLTYRAGQVLTMLSLQGKMGAKVTWPSCAQQLKKRGHFLSFEVFSSTEL